MSKKINTENELQEIRKIYNQIKKPGFIKKKVQNRSKTGDGTGVYLNLFKEIHPENKKMYENAHSRILGAILKYNHNQFLKSFLKRCGINRYVPTTSKIVNVEIERQYTKSDGNWKHNQDYKRKDIETMNYCRPDCLVWHYNQYAIIIENKINHAPETKCQVDNYISAILHDCGDDKGENKGVFKSIDPNNKNNIYIIYLGGDTAEMPSEMSLSNKFGKLFLNEDNGDRIPGTNLKLISYKDTIIPWLEEDVLPECPYGEVGLTGGLMVYIDYLKHHFSEYQSETGMVYDDKDVVFIRDNFEKELLPFFYEKYMAVCNRITDLSNKLSEGPLASNEEEELNLLQAIKHFFLKNHFQFKNPSLNDTWTIRTTGAFVHVWKKTWECIQIKNRLSCELRFELFPYQIDIYLKEPTAADSQTFTCCLRYTGKDDEFKDMLNKELESNKCVRIDEYIFNKETRQQRYLKLKTDGRFFESFVEDEYILNMCTIIEKVIIDRFGR